MWGNTLGWCISAVLLAALLGGVALLNRPLEVSAATEFGRDANNLAVLAFTPPGPRGVTSMPDSGDASQLYRDAITEYDAHRAEYEAFASNGRADAIDRLAALKVLLRAAPISHAQIFARQPADIVNYDNEHPRLETLKALGAIAARAALLAQKAEPSGSAAGSSMGTSVGADNSGNAAQKARPYLEAEFSLGSKLFDERLNAAELLAGLELMSDATAGLRKHADGAGDTQLSRRLKLFDEDRQQLWQSRVMSMLRVLESADAPTIGQHTGDYFYLARHAADRCWRVEAILAMGRLKYFVGEGGTVGDQRAAGKFVRDLAEDPNEDQVIRQAAKAARDLTIEQYRTIH
jgi:hypothetical protein